MSDTGIGGRDELGQLVEGRSDDEITEFVQAAGVDTVLAQIFEGMQQAFNPSKAAGQSAVVQWDVTAPDGPHSWTVKIADGTCTATTGAADAPRLTLGLSLPDFVRFVSGHLDGMQAFMTGKLRLQGDLMFAQQMQAFFDS